MQKIEIIYEDKDILVCAKPAGVAVQSGSVTMPDMENMLRSQIMRDPKIKNKISTLHVIHRLDQPVEGVVVFGRNKEAAASLSKQVQEHGDMSKTYLAVVCGAFPPEDKKGELTDYLLKDNRTKTAVVVSKEALMGKPSGDTKSKKAKGSSADGVKKAVLNYEVIAERSIDEVSANNVVEFAPVEVGKDKSDRISLVRINLKTGRFHQIRAQFSNIGHPLLGDRRYMSEASDEVSARLRVKNVALCACRLEFIHPTTGEKMSFSIMPKGDIFQEFPEASELS